MNEDWYCTGCLVIHEASVVPYLGVTPTGERDLYCAATFTLRVARDDRERVA